MNAHSMDNYVDSLPIVKAEIPDFERILQAIGEANSGGILKSSFSGFSERMSQMSINTTGRSGQF